MSELRDFLRDKTDPDARAVHASLVSFAYDGRPWLYWLYRARYPLLGLLYRAALYGFLWRQVAADYPIFDWTPLFLQLQIIFIFEAAIEACGESLRSELRQWSEDSVRRRDGSFVFWSTVAIGLSCVPLLWVLARLASSLQVSGRYFGLYDAILLIAAARLVLGTIQKLQFSRIGYRRRLPLYVWNWMAPAAVGITAYFATEQRIGPWSIAVYLAAETIASVAAQAWRFGRLKAQGMVSDHIPRFRPRAGTSGLAAHARRWWTRAPAMIVLATPHFFILLIFRSGALEPDEAAALHVVSPLLQFLSRAPVMLWKDLLDLGPGRFTRPLLDRVGRVTELLAVAGLVASFALASADPSLAKAVGRAAGTALALGLSVAWVLEAWLWGRLNFRLGAAWILAALAVATYWHPLMAIAGSAWIVLVSAGSWFPRGERRTSREDWIATLRSHFWRRNVRVAALTELERLGIRHEVQRRKLVFPRGQDRHAEILAWGRGWIVDFRRDDGSSLTAEALPPTGASACFDLSRARWVTPPRSSALRALDASEKRRLLLQILRAAELGQPRGSIRLNTSRVRWTRAGDRVYL